ncbi:hypothetical protein C7S14_5150 [Burkholderia cepacia]|nr:hypothetical protein C7S14_5150 [Burkholderia cepacia]
MTNVSDPKNKNGAPETERRDASTAGRQAGLSRYRMSDA